MYGVLQKFTRKYKLELQKPEDLIHMKRSSIMKASTESVLLEWAKES